MGGVVGEEVGEVMGVEVRGLPLGGPVPMGGPVPVGGPVGVPVGGPVLVTGEGEGVLYISVCVCVCVCVWEGGDRNITHSTQGEIQTHCSSFMALCSSVPTG